MIVPILYVFPGILLENAGNTVLNMALDQNTFPDVYTDNYYGLESSLEKMARAGITSLVDARCNSKIARL